MIPQIGLYGNHYSTFLTRLISLLLLMSQSVTFTVSCSVFNKYAGRAEGAGASNDRIILSPPGGVPCLTGDINVD